MTPGCSLAARSRRWAAALLVAALCAAPVAEAAAPQPRPELRLGLIPEINIFKQKARHRPLADYLSKKLGVPVRFTVVAHYGDAIESFQRAGVDGVFFGSLAGAVALQRFGAVPLARPVSLEGTSTYRGYLFVRKDAGIRSPGDLRGKRMALVDRTTSAGYVFALGYLRQHGIQSPDRFLGKIFFAGSHDAAIYAVLHGEADIAAAKSSVYEQLRLEDARIEQELLVIAESPKVPSNALFVRRDLPETVRGGLKRALLALEHDADGGVVLGALRVKGFVETSAADYGPVEEMAKQAGMDLRTYAVPASAD